MNKRGDKLLSIYWFAILVLIAGGIFLMVYNFYNHPYDVREIEAEVLINSVADCLSSEGKINSELIYEGNFSEEFEENFLEKCHLAFESEVWELPQYYTEINFYNSSDLDSSVFNITKGNKNLVSGCVIQEEKEYEREVKCVEEEFFSFDENNNLYLIKILSIVRKTEKNAK